MEAKALIRLLSLKYITRLLVTNRQQVRTWEANGEDTIRVIFKRLASPFDKLDEKTKITKEDLRDACSDATDLANNLNKKKRITEEHLRDACSDATDLASLVNNLNEKKKKITEKELRDACSTTGSLLPDISRQELKVAVNEAVELTRKDTELTTKDTTKPLYPVYRAICDFVAGMTDRYASEYYARLTGNQVVSCFKPF